MLRFLRLPAMVVAVLGEQHSYDDVSVLLQQTVLGTDGALPPPPPNSGDLKVAPVQLRQFIAGEPGVPPPPPQPVAGVALFEPGDQVTVTVEGGQLKDTRVPAVVKSRKPNERYHVRVMTLPVSKDVINVDKTLMHKVDDAGYAAALAEIRSKEGLFMSAATQLEKEATIRSRSEAADRKLNNTETVKYLNFQRNVLEVELRREAMAAGCPGSYTLVHGNGRISDHLSNATVDSAAACGELCDANAACRSFQWSPTKKQCFVESAETPAFRQNYKDFLFCGKGSFQG